MSAFCETCPHYRPPEDGKGPGECRHRSPRAMQDRSTGAWRSAWPRVWGPRDWCGVHPGRSDEMFGQAWREVDREGS